MPCRTFAIGDIHGDFEQLAKLISRMPEFTEDDTIVFLGDYVDRGPHSARVIEYVRNVLPGLVKAKIVTLRGNHEDGWLSVIDAGGKADAETLSFVLTPGNGCGATWKSYSKDSHDFSSYTSGKFFPEDVVEWMRSLPLYYEDRHAIYVHAGLKRVNGRWLHPKETRDKRALLWERSDEFYREYSDKRVVCGHTPTQFLPQELSVFTPQDPTDMWATNSVLVLDTGCGKGGFLTALQLPELYVYESRAEEKD